MNKFLDVNTAKSITKNLLTIVTSSLEKLTNLSSDNSYLLRRDFSPSQPSPTYPFAPSNSPTSSKLSYESYRPRDSTAFKKYLRMTPTTTVTPPEESPDSSSICLTPSQSLEEDSIDWQFNGPLVTGPLSNAQPMDTNLPRVFDAAGKRRELQKGSKLWLRREYLLAIAENFLNRSSAPPARTLNRSAEGAFRKELALLSSVLLCFQWLDPNSSKEGYQFDKWKYKQLITQLQNIAAERYLYAQALVVQPPSLPSLPNQWPIDSLWSSSEMEILCVTLREDVENYLAFWWDIVAKARGTFIAVKNDLPSPCFPDPSDKCDPEIFKLRYTAALAVLLRKNVGDRAFDCAVVKPEAFPEPIRSLIASDQENSSRTSVNNPPSNPNLFQPEMDPDSPLNHQAIKQRQSLIYSNPQSSVPLPSPYNRNPTQLTRSDGIEEIYEIPAKHRRRTVFTVPETPVPPISRRSTIYAEGNPPDSPDGSDNSCSETITSPHHQEQYTLVYSFTWWRWTSR